MSFVKRFALLDIAIVLLGSVVCLKLLGYFELDWSKPARLDADHLFILTSAKGYMNGHGFRFETQLGYPDVRDGLMFPGFDLSYRLFLWLASQITKNPFQVAHALYVTGVAAMFGLAYWTLKRLNVRSWLSAVGAVSYVITPFLANRIFSHDFLALSFSVPVGFGLALMIGVSRPDMTLKRFMRDPFTIATILIVGTSGLYYAFYGLMFLAFVGVAASAAQRRWFPLLAAVSAGVPLFAILIFGAFGLDLAVALSGKVTAPHRFAYEQLMYGLDLRAMARPFARLGGKVAEGIAQADIGYPNRLTATEGSAGEWPALPLMLALVSTPLVAAMCLSAQQVGEAVAGHVRLIGWCAVCIVFAILFGASGGLGYLFNLLVSPEIRADGRLMPYLNFGAIIILCAGAELLARSGNRWLGYAGQVVVAVMLIVSIKPALGAARKMERLYMTDPGEMRLQASTPAMLEAKNKAGLRTILQLPAASWPEAPFVVGLDSYEHQLPYIYDTPGNPTRWSYGANDHQPWFGLVKLATSNPQTLVDRARRFGFDGVLIQKRGFEPPRLGALQAALSAQLAPGCKLFEDDVEVLYAIGRRSNGAAC